MTITLGGIYQVTKNKDKDKLVKFKLILFLFTLSIISAQSRSQIEQAKLYIQSEGLSKSQVLKLAKDQGYSEKEINNVIKKEQKIKTEKVRSPTSDNTTRQNKVVDISNSQDLDQTVRIKQDEAIYSQKLLPVVDNSEESQLPALLTSNQEIEVAYYGYDIFERDPALFQASSTGAVDPDYIIGPGDEIIVMLWGETQFREVLSVNKEGFVFIPEIGQVFVNGLNLNLLESKLFRVLSQSYSSLNPQGFAATTFIDISLGNLRPLRVQVIGEVAQPGAYTISPSATLFSSLYYFNGPTLKGSLRDIHLIRNGKIISKIDFYDYLLTGKKNKDEKLQLDDVIFIPKRLKTVSIKGEVNRPGVYELKSGEGFKDMLKISGGLSITAYLGRAQIDRIVPFKERPVLGIDRMFKDLKLSDILEKNQSLDLYDGDIIEIFSIQDTRQNLVQIEGAISRAGFYDLGDSLSLKELIKKADGINGDAYLERVDIIRQKLDATEKLIKLNLEKALKGNRIHDIMLKNQDKVRVYGSAEMIPKTYVSITGKVKNPGRYLLQENMNLYDLIFKSGGVFDEQFRDSIYLDKAELIRFNKDNGKKRLIHFNLGEVLKKKGMANDLLKPNDFIKIYSLSEVEGETKYISIKGNVKYPGSYELFQDNMTLLDMLFKAGGLNDEEFKATTYLDRGDLFRYDINKISKKIISFNINSLIKDPKSAKNLNLKPGDEIIIYSKRIFNTLKKVSIAGAISNPGDYQLKENMTFKDLILEAGGVSDDIYKYKVEIARIKKIEGNKDTLSLIIKYEMLNDYSLLSQENFGKILEKKDQPTLEPYDNIFIRPDPFYQERKKVTLSGSVLYPGDYIISHKDETIADILERAGGLTFDAFPLGSSFIRNNQEIRINMKKLLMNDKKEVKNDIKLQNGDIIDVAKKPEMILISGAVNTPGYYKYYKGQRVLSAIKKAGGFTKNANKAEVYIKYPSGSSKKFKRFLSNPKIEDGSNIVIAFNPEKEQINRTELAKTITSVVANLAQAISIILLAKG